MYGEKSSLILLSLSYGFFGTAMLIGLNIFLSLGTLVGHYRSYNVSLLDPMFWLVQVLGLLRACITCVLVIGLASLIVMKWRRKQ